MAESQPQILNSISGLLLAAMFSLLPAVKVVIETLSRRALQITFGIIEQKLAAL